MATKNKIVAKSLISWATDSRFCIEVHTHCPTKWESTKVATDSRFCMEVHMDSPKYKKYKKCKKVCKSTKVLYGSSYMDCPTKW